VLALDGVDDSASAADAATLDIGVGATDDFTVETFFYVPDELNSTGDTLFEKAARTRSSSPIAPPHRTTLSRASGSRRSIM
jgi:hypothetical protein